MLVCCGHAVRRCQITFYKKWRKAGKRRQSRLKCFWKNANGFLCPSFPWPSGRAECFVTGLLRSWPRARLTLVDHQYPAGTSGALKWPLHQRESGCGKEEDAMLLTICLNCAPIFPTTSWLARSSAMKMLHSFGANWQLSIIHPLQASSVGFNKIKTVLKFNLNLYNSHRRCITHLPDARINMIISNFAD